MRNADIFISQALGRLAELDTLLGQAAAGAPDWPAVRAIGVSLRRNLESAAAELKRANGGTEP